MKDDVECPYCGEGQEINHDDGYGYEEDRRHAQTCADCEKTFVFTTSISYYYEAEKSDCLNGAEHRVRFSTSYPQEEYSRMCCQDCDWERKPTPEEFAAAGIVLPASRESGEKA